MNGCLGINQRIETLDDSCAHNYVNTILDKNLLPQEPLPADRFDGISTSNKHLHQDLRDQDNHHQLQQHPHNYHNKNRQTQLSATNYNIDHRQPSSNQNHHRHPNNIDHNLQHQMQLSNHPNYQT